MGGTVNAAEAAVRNTQGNAQGAAAEHKQGVLDGRQVSVQAEANPALRGSPEAGAGDTAERTSLDSRQATAVSPASPGTNPATEPLSEERTTEPPAASATATPSGSASASTLSTDRLAQVLTPPDLEPMVLTNAQGVTLFKGVRHGILDAAGLDLPLLNSLPDDQLRSLLLQMHPLLRNVSPSYQQSRIARYAEGIRATDSSKAGTYLEFLQNGVRRHLAEEVAAAALAMDLQKCERALDRETVDLHLCAVSLTRPEAHGVLQQQVTDLARLTPASRREASLLPQLDLGFPDESRDLSSHALRLRDPDGVQQTVLARVRVRQFALSSAGERIDPFKVRGKLNQPKDQLEQLIGPIGANRLAGDAQDLPQVDESFRRDLMRTGISAAKAARTASRIAKRLSKARASNLASVETESRSPKRASTTLLEAAEQLKAIWAERGDWPPSANAHLRAAALIALAAHHVGDTPLLISNDNDLAERLETEVMCLVTYADSHDGHLPPFDSSVQE